ncbi:hypothetical protein JUNP543_1205 [Acinetobacter baumannii]|uniref:hypothetical protein n=1 Tax=Acinetobacter calcoaceticus/baumannii complex TaxID=909768 RepID=UPI00140D7E8E|nr:MULTISPECIES: hypothetical protein [Acinetobacter calcoaceticus/baumannii complex]MBN6525306.1 hypothetical protein [Acinetobacter pittii]NHQ49415.1 hypothetical protein [Acinetobacter baumannii]HAV6044756.1 hypothetical protein [Acinetobacter baumannii]HAV6145732.1 hypothetical protein [Acinetobacter baumannii]HAV6163766.1 hypothetical protein [Acinetobacter baumannii]
MTDSNASEKCWKCGKVHGSNDDGSGYQPCRSPRPKPAPPPPTVSTPPIKWDEVSNVTPEQMNQIRELTLKKVFLSVLLISIPILLWKLDSIIMALKA